jgi:hypothetical protein
MPRLILLQYSLGELLDRCLMTPVESLLDQLAATVRAPGKRYPLLVQVVVSGSVSAVDSELDHQPPQFRAGKAGANDRAMHAVMHVPDRGPTLSSGRGEFADGRFGGARLHWDHATRERGRQLAIREDVQQHLMGTRRHGPGQYAVFISIQRLLAYIGNFGKRISMQVRGVMLSKNRTFGNLATDERDA